MTRPVRLTFATLACLAALASPGLAATARADTQSQLQDTRARLAHAHAMYESAKARESKLSSQVAAYDSQLGSIGARLADIERQQAALGAKLSATRAELARLHEEYAVKQAQLAKARKALLARQLVFEKRVVATYKTHDVDYLDVLVGASGYDDLVTRIGMVDQLVGADNALVGRLAAAHQQVQSEKEAVAAVTAATASAQDSLQKQLDRLTALRAAAQQQQTALATARGAKDGLLEEAATTRAAWEQQQQELQAESARLAAIIRGNSGAGATHGTGAMVWPVSGPVTSPFGWRSNPFTGAKDFHPGIDIGVPYGTPIHAADSGTVIYAGAGMTGYGNCIVIDHGEGVSTLYGHQSALAVTSGSVRRGQVIGYVGSTGYSTGPHLHFEVRLNGNPVDPMGYLP